MVPLSDFSSLLNLRLVAIGKIVMPSVRTTTFAHLVVLTVLLYARTVLRSTSFRFAVYLLFIISFFPFSLKVADITGTNAQYIVQQNLRYILLGVIQFGLIGIILFLVVDALPRL